MKIQTEYVPKLVLIKMPNFSFSFICSLIGIVRRLDKNGGCLRNVDTGCSNLICTKKPAYKAIKNALLSHKNGICTFIGGGILIKNYLIYQLLCFCGHNPYISDKITEFSV